MTHSVSQRPAGDLRIHSSGIRPPIKAEDTQHALFRSAVMDALYTRMQDCVDDSARDALRQVADAFQQSKDIVLPKCTDKDGAPDKKTVNRFITGLIQNRLHDLDAKVSERLHLSMPAEKASAALHRGMTHNRIAPLTAAYERAENGTFLKACLGECLSAATAQGKKAEYLLFMAGLPDTIKTLSNQVDKLVAAKKDNDRERCIRFTEGLKALVITEVEANKAKIQELSHQNRAYNDQYIDKLETREEKIAALNKACEQNCADLESLIEQLARRESIHALPPSLGPAAEAFLSDQTVLTGVREQLTAAEKDATRSPEQSRVAVTLKDTQVKSERLLSEKIDLTSRITKLSQEADSRSRFGDFALRIRRIFGGGSGQKTRADYHAEIRPLKAMLEKVQGAQKQTSREIQTLKTTLSAELNATEQRKLQQAQRITTLKIQLSDTESRFEKSRENLKLAAESEISSLKNNLVEERLAVMAAFYKQDEPMEEASSGRLEKIRLLEEVNARLEKRLKNDLLSAENFRLLTEQLPHSPERDYLSQSLSEIEHERSKESAQYLAIQDLRSICYECKCTHDRIKSTWGTDLNNIAIAEINTLREKLESQGIDTHFRFDPETTQDLIQAGKLYALQSIDKVISHPLAEAVAKAAELVPRTLALLSSLEKEVKLTASKDKDFISEAALIRRDERMEKIDEQLSGIRRIVMQKHDKALSISADFNEQRYIDGIDAYVDRQYRHGTCTMHSWNNLLAYLSDNQHLQMTPWRMEKLIQSEVVQSAHKLLSELLDAHGHHVLSLKRVERTLEKVLRASDLVSPSRLQHFVQHGHLMNYETRRPNDLRAENNNLRFDSLHLFDLADLKGDNLYSFTNMFVRDDSDKIKKGAALNALILKAHDAYLLCFAHNISGHALALIRSEDDFALIDSNFTEPVKLTLPQLVDFISTGNSHSDEVNEKLIARGYDKYSVLYFTSAFYKEQRT